MQNNTRIGDFGENIAEGFLRAKGYEILAKKYKAVNGEIDLVAKLDDVVVFVEVKLRRSLKSGYGAESVTKTKQRSIIRTATRYIQKERTPCRAYRFDVIEVFGREQYEVKHIEGAFYAE